MVDWVYPQDWGTTSNSYGTQSGDPNDAANFGALAAASQPVSCIVEGLTFSTFDTGVPDIDVDAGKVFLVGDGFTSGNSGETRDAVGFVASVNARTDVALTDSAVNHVYVEADISTDDSVSITVNTTGTAPSAMSHKIGEVDTSNDTTSEQWRLIDGNVFSYPSRTAADSDAANFASGAILYDRATKTHLRVDGNTVNQLARGIDYVQATAPSAPAAGQEWLDTSVSPAERKVYYNGSWEPDGPRVAITHQLIME